jgi:O-acetyl-ADP-ribose deacetylase (regulator of RNase III)
MFQLEEMQGDLFDSNASLCHCVSEDLVMGKGIAEGFKERFKQVKELKSQHVKVGGMATLQDETRFIYYLVTKRKYFHKPTYESLRNSLKQMKQHMEQNKITDLAMPRIGCGLDRLEWTKVKEMILRLFGDCDNLKIIVYEKRNPK